MTIEEFEELPDFAKNRLLKFAKDMREEKRKVRNLLEIAKLDGEAEVVFANDEYAIIKKFFSSIKGFEDQLFTAVYQSDGEWRATFTYFPTFEDTLFYILGVIKEGVSSHFGDYVSKLFKAL